MMKEKRKKQPNKNLQKTKQKTYIFYIFLLLFSPLCKLSSDKNLSVLCLLYEEKNSLAKCCHQTLWKTRETLTAQKKIKSFHTED